MQADIHTDPRGVTRTERIRAPSLAEAVELALDAMDDAPAEWVPWRIQGSRTIRGRRASLELVWLHRDEVARRKQRR